MMRVVAVAVLFALAGCASTTQRKPAPTSQVGARMILPPMANTLKVESNQVFLMAGHLNPEHLPDYPAERMADGPEELRICVELVVDEGGEVTRALPLHGGPECPAAAAEHIAVFEQAAPAAVREWQFTAAAICHFPPGVEKNDRCEGEGVEEKAMALRLAFVFEFSRHEGKARFARSSGG